MSKWVARLTELSVMSPPNLAVLYFSLFDPYLLQVNTCPQSADNDGKWLSYLNSGKSITVLLLKQFHNYT